VHQNFSNFKCAFNAHNVTENKVIYKKTEQQYNITHTEYEILKYYIICTK